MKNGLMKKIAPLLISVPLIFGSCHKQEPLSQSQSQSREYVSSEDLYEQGVVLEDRITRDVIDTEVIKRSIDDPEIVLKEKSQESLYGYSLTVSVENRIWILSINPPRMPTTFGEVNAKETIKTFDKTRERLYNEIKPGDEIKFLIGYKTLWSDGSEGENLHYKEPENGGDIEYTLHTVTGEGCIEKIK